MSKIVLKMSVSLDGFVSKPDGDVEWIFRSFDDEVTAWQVERLWRASFHAMGSAPYKDMAAYWPSSGEPYAPPMNQVPKLVFSKSLQQADWADTRIVTGDLEAEIARLRQQEGEDVLVHGGARFAHSLTKLGLVDEYVLLIHPVALGRGVPLFPDLEEPIDLKLVTAKQFKTGTVVHVYQPA